MGPRTVALAVLAIGLTIATPLFVAKQLQLGGEAKSPQTATVMVGGRVIVGGGRATLWYAGGNTGGDFELSNSKETRYFEPEPKQTYAACGVRVQLIEVDDRHEGKPLKATFRIEWK